MSDNKEVIERVDTHCIRCEQGYLDNPITSHCADGQIHVWSRDMPEMEKALQAANAELTSLRQTVERWERMFSKDTPVTIDGRNWSITYNGNPADLFALRQFTDTGDMTSYTHHDSALAAFESITADEVSPEPTVSAHAHGSPEVSD